MFSRALSLVLALPAAALRHRAAEVSSNDTVWPHRGPDDYPAWKLYPFRSTPGKAVQRLKSESFAASKSTDALVIHCMGANFTIEQHYGYKLEDVSVPTLIPFVVPMEQLNRTDAAVVVVPGGGGTRLSFETEGTDICRWFNSQGISAFLLKYRVPGASWADWVQLMDLQRAVSLVRHKATSLHLNASRVGFFGASAGGHLALEASSLRVRLYKRVDEVDDHPFVPNFNVLLYPSAPEFFYHPNEPENRELYNLTQIPLTFITSAADDKCVTVDEVLNLYEAMHAGGLVPQNNNTELHLYPTGGHGFSLCYRRGLEWMREHDVCTWTTKAASFLRKKVLQNAGDVIPIYWKLREALNGTSVGLDRS